MQPLEKQVPALAEKSTPGVPLVRLLQGGGAEPLDPAAAASRIIRSLTSRQASRLAGEIEILS